MQKEIRDSFRLAISNALPHLQPLLGQFITQYLKWQKQDSSQWSGKYEARPDLSVVIAVAANAIEEVSASFRDLFARHYPDFTGMVGFRGGGRQNWTNNRSQIVGHAISTLWSRHKTLVVTDEQIDAVVEEFAQFVETRTVRVRFFAQLLNFKMAADELNLPDALIIRRLNDDEVSELHGGPVHTLGWLRARSSTIHEFVLEGHLEMPISFGDASNEQMIADEPQAVMDKAVLALRTFKPGHVGYDYIHFRPTTFCPLGLFSLGAGDLHLPNGTYSLSVLEEGEFTEHAKLIMALSDEAMKMACSRLADAENRTRAQDRIVDSVIGMEALLLAAITDRKTELSFRFALNYAMLFKLPERHHAYRLARDLYGLRSTIAHGSSVGNSEVKIAEEKVTLDEAGRRATATLRTIIFHFLKAKGTPYKKSEYWLNSYFGSQVPG